MKDEIREYTLRFITIFLIFITGSLLFGCERGTPTSTRNEKELAFTFPDSDIYTARYQDSYIVIKNDDIFFVKFDYTFHNGISDIIKYTKIKRIKK